MMACVQIQLFIAFLCTLRFIFLSKEHAGAQTVHCLASPSTSDQLEQLEITHTGSDSTLINIYVFKSALILSKGHARAQIVACQASPSTRDTFHQLEITRKRDRITLINICVFKSANIAVLGLLLHHPDRNLE